MWVRTRMIEANTNCGWWGVIDKIVMEFKLEYDGSDLTRYGQDMLRYWGTRGFCFKPAGKMAAMWEVLMYKHRAEYIATHANGYTMVRFLNPARADQFKEKVKDFGALLSLSAAADDRQRGIGIYGRMDLTSTFDPPQYDMIRLRGSSLRTAAQISGCVPTRQLMDTLVETLGHPLGDRLPAYIEDIGSTFALPAKLTNTRMKSRSRKTTTEVSING